VLLIVGAGAAWRGWVYARQNLPGWLSAQLSEDLERPVEIGPIERISPTGIRVGPFALPATPTDPDSLRLEALEIKLNPLNLLRRELPLVINLEQVDMVLEQAADGQWVDLDLQLRDEDRDREPFLDIRVARVNLQDGRLTLVPYVAEVENRPQVVLEDIQGQGDITPIPIELPEAITQERTRPLKAQQIDLDIRGTSIQSGSVNLAGSVKIPPADPDKSKDEPVENEDIDRPTTPDATLAVNLNLRTQKALATDIMPLVESFLDGPLPVQFPTGHVSGSVDIVLEGEQPISYTGTARVEEGTVVTKGLPEPLQDLQGDVRFKGQVIGFENVTARLGDLTAKAGGDLDFKTGYDFKGQVNPFTVAQISELFAFESPVAATGTFLANVTMTGPLAKPVLTTELLSQDTVTLDQVPFADVRVNTILKAPKLEIASFQAIPQDGGSITGNGIFTFGEPGQLALSLTGDRLPGDAIGRLYGLPETLVLGPVFAEAEVSGPIDQLTGNTRWRAPAGTYPAQGTIALANNTLRFTDTFVQVAGGTVAGQGTLALSSRQWESTVRATELQMDQLGLGVAGTVNGEGQFAGVLDASGLQSIQGQGVAQATLAGGVVNSRGNLSQGRWTADVQGNNLQMAAFSPNLQGNGSGQFRFSGTTDNLSLAGVQGQGQLVLSDGLATAAPLAPQLAVVQEPLTADLAWNGRTIVVQQASTAGLRANGTITPLLSGPAAPGIANLDLNLSGNDVNLAALPIPNQVVPVRGTGDFTGRLVGSPSTLAFDGTANLTGLALGELAFASPLTGPVQFSRGDGVLVDLRETHQRPEGDRLYVSSRQTNHDLEFLVRSGAARAEGHIQGDTYLAEIFNLPLDDLKLPQDGIEGVGTLSGTVEEATISGNWREPTVRAEFVINDPGLGWISLQTAEVETSINGEDSDPQPPVSSLETRYGQLTGSLSYANRVISLEGVSIESASGESRYMVSGIYALDESRVHGSLTVDNGQIQDILLTLKIFELSDFRLNLLQPPNWFRPVTKEDVASLETTQVGDSNASLLDQLRRFAEVRELQDILAAEADAAVLPPLEGLQGRFSGTVTALGIVPEDVRVDVDLAGTNWLWKDPSQPTGIAYRVDEIIARATYQDEVIRLNPIRFCTEFPTAVPLTEAIPVNSGCTEIASDSSPDPNLALAELNGEFSLNENDPVDRTLRLNVSEVPIEAVRRPLRIPPNLNGSINIGASLTGNLNDPQVRGRLQVNNATINRQSIDVATTDFIYRDARLNLLSNVAIQDEVNPLRLVASVPLVLAGSNRQPASDRVSIRLRVNDEGFALVNLLTQAIAWEGGPADLALNVDGRWPTEKTFEEALTSLVVTGAATFDGVTVSSRSLPEPLTNIQGDIRVVEGQGIGNNQSVYFNGLVLDFQNLQGNFSNGQVLANGKLSIVPSVYELFPGVVGSGAIATDPTPPLETEPLPPSPEEADQPPSPPIEAEPAPLPSGDDRFRLTLDNIALDFRNPAGTYRGNLDGEMVVDGSLYLLEPLIYGDIQLSNGVATLPDTEIREDAIARGSTGAISDPSIFQPLPAVLEDFNITLADNVRLAIPGIVDVTAAGTLALVGTLPDVKPDGRINMPSGRINLLTTEFRLTGNENYAEFSAQDERIDPYLVANLSATVSDTVGSTTSLVRASPFPRNEISDAAINQLGLTQSGVQTVRIRASVNGRASRVIQLQGVELTSTPSRTESEIITLISSEFLIALESTLGSVSGGGDSFQGLLAFAGSALLNRLQGLIGAGLDNTDLRLFSASPPGSQQVDVGGEIGFNFSPNISVSVQKVFTNITPAVFSVRYRVNDNITIRAITSYEQFNENTGAVLEFRF
jgi:translocation and assembly module TamB